jgi:OmpA-OmpF porin, OOP family
MIRPKVRAVTAAAGLGVGLALLAGSGPAAADADPPYTGPTSVPDDAALEASVTVAKIEGSVTQFSIEGSVTIFSVTGSVTTLEEETTTSTQVVVTVSSDVLFAFGSASLTSDATAKIDQVAARLPRGGAVKVEGYTDAIGTDAANLVLSRQRAQAVAARLKRARPDVVPAALGHGEADPVQPNTLAGVDNPAGRAKNRRVVIVFGR